jgi:two-component system sensor histidine kinase/response regulator
MTQCCHVLLVEDNAVHVTLSEAILETAQCSFKTVRNGQEAVLWVQKEAFQLALMDFHMPVMTGLAATLIIREWEAREKRKRLPIVGVTASAMPHEVEECLAAGMDEVITKPFKVHELLMLIQQYCG